MTRESGSILLVIVCSIVDPVGSSAGIGREIPTEDYPALREPGAADHSPPLSCRIARGQSVHRENQARDMVGRRIVLN